MRKIAILSVLWMLAACSAGAASLTWYLQGVTFDDGTTVSGYLQFDASSSVVTGWDITVQDSPTYASVLPAFEYTALNSGTFVFTGNVEIAFNDDADTRELDLAFVTALTGTGGTIALDTAQSSERNYTDEEAFRNITAGTVTTASPTVTEPGTATLAGGALLIAGMRCLRHRRKPARELRPRSSDTGFTQSSGA